MDQILKIRNGFLGILILLSIFMIYKMIPRISFNNPIKMVIIKQKGNINRLTDPQIIDFTVNYRIPTINFPDGDELYHPRLGPFGFQSDFFLDLKTKMHVKKEGTYQFSVASDDGFRLLINNNLIGEYVDNRPMSTNQYNVYLKEGDYSLGIYYYQGFGRMGLIAGYQFANSKKFYLIGKNSEFINFYNK